MVHGHQGVTASLGDEVAAGYLVEKSTALDERLRLYSIVWKAGDAAGLAGIADTLPERAQPPSGTTQDMVEAYAHQLLFARLLESARVTPLGPLRARLLREEQDRLRNMERLLLVNQVATGADRAAEILASNGSKCFPL
jgi:hypothetical protein